jgi:hypothetical protein
MLSEATNPAFYDQIETLRSGCASAQGDTWTACCCGKQ